MAALLFDCASFIDRRFTFNRRFCIWDLCVMWGSLSVGCPVAGRLAAAAEAPPRVGAGRQDRPFDGAQDRPGAPKVLG